MQLVMIPIRIRCAHWGELTEDECAEIRHNLIIDGYVSAADCEPLRAHMSDQGRLTRLDVRHPDLGDGQIMLLAWPDTAHVCAILVCGVRGYPQHYIAGGWLELTVGTLVEME